jgi:hypothetical protein
MPRRVIQSRKMPKMPKLSKTKSRKNNIAKHSVMLKKTKMDLKQYADQLKNLESEIELIDPIANFEIYQVKTKLIYLLLLELALDGAKASMKLANKYSERTGIKFDIKKFKSKSRKTFPTFKNAVKDSIKSAANPDAASIAAGWKW